MSENEKWFWLERVLKFFFQGELLAEVLRKVGLKFGLKKLLLTMLDSGNKELVELTKQQLSEAIAVKNNRMKIILWSQN